jgi:hypothetical protein
MLYTKFSNVELPSSSYPKNNIIGGGGDTLPDYKTGDPSIAIIRSFCLVSVISERSDPSNQYNELHEIVTGN